MKDRWESAQKDAEHYKQIAMEKADTVASLKRGNEELAKEAFAFQTMYEDAVANGKNLLEAATSKQAEIDKLTCTIQDKEATIHDRDMEIIGLKAKLYDLLCKD